MSFDTGGHAHVAGVKGAGNMVRALDRRCW